MRQSQQSAYTSVAATRLYVGCQAESHLLANTRAREYAWTCDSLIISFDPTISWRILDPGNTHGVHWIPHLCRITFDYFLQVQVSFKCRAKQVHVCILFPLFPPFRMLMTFTDGSPDCYGREHHDDGDTKWPLNQRDCGK